MGITIANECCDVTCIVGEMYNSWSLKGIRVIIRVSAFLWNGACFVNVVITDRMFQLIHDCIAFLFAINICFFHLFRAQLSLYDFYIRILILRASCERSF